MIIITYIIHFHVSVYMTIVGIKSGIAKSRCPFYIMKDIPMILPNEYALKTNINK